MGGRRSGSGGRSERHSDRLGQSLRAVVRGPVLDRGRSYGQAGARGLERFHTRHREGRSRRRHNAEAVTVARRGKVPPRLDDGVFQYSRYARPRRSTQLGWLRHP